jgi:hypothetical protein
MESGHAVFCPGADLGFGVGVISGFYSQGQKVVGVILKRKFKIVICNGDPLDLVGIYSAVRNNESQLFVIES